ncbi:TPA: hypothetical protein ACXPQL_004125 [Salmonella enterica]
MDFEKLIADGMINTVVDEAGNKFYVWSDKVERPIIPFVKDCHFLGKPCPKCGSTLRYISTRRCVECWKKRELEKKRAKKAAAND